MNTHRVTYAVIAALALAAALGMQPGAFAAEPESIEIQVREAARTLERLFGELEDLRRTAEEMARTYVEDAPQIVELRSQIESRERAVRETEERLGDLEAELEVCRGGRPEPRPLGKTVTLTFTLNDEAPVTVTTAISHYRIQGNASTRAGSGGPEREDWVEEEVAFEIGGEVMPLDKPDKVLIIFNGHAVVVRNTHAAESGEARDTSVSEHMMGFEASNVFRSGDRKIITSQGGHTLSVQVTIEPTD